MFTTGAALGAAGAIAMAYQVRGRSASLLAPSYYCGSPNRRTIALTFDDGPGPGSVELLSALSEYSVSATFFQCGWHVRRNPALAREIAAAGHEIANHTDTHPLLCFHSSQFITDQLERAQESLQAATGQTPRWFRAPYGVRWFGLAAAQRACGLTNVMWTAIALDWKLPEQQIAERLRTRARNGAIFCLHDGRGLQPDPDIRATIGAVKRLLPALLADGYQFETVSQILCPTTSKPA